MLTFFVTAFIVTVMSKKKALSPGLLKAIAASDDSVQELARRLGISDKAIYKWHDVPLQRVTQVEQATGVAREHLRPDFFGPHLNIGRKSRAAAAA